MDEVDSMSDNALTVGLGCALGGGGIGFIAGGWAGALVGAVVLFGFFLVMYGLVKGIFSELRK